MAAMTIVAVTALILKLLMQSAAKELKMTYPPTEYLYIYAVSGFTAGVLVALAGRLLRIRTLSGKVSRCGGKLRPTWLGVTMFAAVAMSILLSAIFSEPGFSIGCMFMLCGTHVGWGWYDSIEGKSETDK